MKTAGAIALLISLLAIASPDQAPPPTRIVVNARVWTGDPSMPEAQALAIAGERIAAVGSTADVRALAGPGTDIVDAGGRRVVPGFNDAHWHLPSRRTADLAGADSVAEILARLREFALASPPGAWITGRGWKPTDFPENRAHRTYLDAAFPDRPVLITDRDGHQALANSHALKLAGVTRTTVDPANGRIDRDDAGEPTGVLKESATSIVRRLMPATTFDDIQASLIAELDKAAAFGLTSLQVASGARPGSLELQAYQRLRASNAMKVRLRVAVSFDRQPSAGRLAEYVKLRDSGDAWLSYGIAKGMLDGTVDAHTAAMLEPYTGSDDAGIPMWEQAALNDAAAAYDRAGLQIELHAIGDRAIRMALDAFEHVSKGNPRSRGRHRIEHVEVPSLADLPRFAALDIIASTQAIFALPDETTLLNYAPALGPERASRANAFRLFDDAGARQAFGSDYPVFPMDPLKGIHAAVTRQTPAGAPEGGWHPQHRLSVQQALRHYTWGSAYASFEENGKGTIAPGRLADFVLLSRDILTEPPGVLLEARVLLTVAGGRVSYRSPLLR